MRTFLAYLAAVLLTAVLASVFSTQMVIAGLSDLNVEIDLATRLGMTLTDLAILKFLLMIIGACFLIGFLIAAFARSKLNGSRKLWFMAAGALAFLSALLLMSYSLQLMPIAGARSSFGLFLQAASGAVGGYLFAKLSTPKEGSNA